MNGKFKVKLVFERDYEDCGEPLDETVIAEYPIDEIVGDKIKYLPATNKMKRDLLKYLKGNEDDT